MEIKRQDSRLLRWANRLSRLVPEYSSPDCSSRTLKPMEVGLLDTPRLSIRAMKLG